MPPANKLEGFGSDDLLDLSKDLDEGTTKMRSARFFA